MIPCNAAVICLVRSDLDLARRIASLLPGASVHGLAKRIADDADVVFDNAMEHVAELFLAGVPIVGVCATGILVRAVAPYLADKLHEPAIVAVSSDGDHFIPILGGHHGANEIARHCAAEISGHAAITTASDSRFGVALESPPKGWRLRDPQRITSFVADILAGEKVALQVEHSHAEWIEHTGLPLDPGGTRTIRVTAREDAEGDLVYRPPVLSVGIGCERNCKPDELLELVHRVIRSSGLSTDSVACVASLDLKADEPAVLSVADALDRPLMLFDSERLERESSRIANPSDVVFAAVGTHGVAEAAALAAAGESGMLVVAKTKSRHATCAVACTTHDINVPASDDGNLFLVGIGPGDPLIRTPEAGRAIVSATDVVGYAYYLELAAPLLRGRTQHPFPIGSERARCKHALDLASQGRQVALICSGDPGVYAMASLVWELVESDTGGAWTNVKIDCVPGVSAVQIAAARAGAPIGHDFCAISLSDLLTPRDEILNRVTAAAAGDFVIAFYNPVSGRRRDLLEEACSILLRTRRRDTPVFVGRLLGREGEQTCCVQLSELRSDHADMMSIVIVGSSRTRHIQHRGRDTIYTPRGYGISD